MNIGIVGLGLIGGSLARAIQTNTPHTVWGADLSRPVVYRAKLLEVIDEELTEDRVGQCDILILALYPRDTVDWVEAHAGTIAKGAVVVDCAGVKRAVCRPCWDIAEQNGFTFIGGHPMEGVAKLGFENSRRDMFIGASMILVPHRDIEIETMKRLKDVFDAIGFTRYEIAAPEQHDRIIALTSQLAHVVSSAYVKSPAAAEHRGFSAGSFRDMTRVAYLNERMWAELFMLNREDLREEIQGLIDRLRLYEAALDTGDEEGLTDLLREGREAKTALDAEEAE
ncbi:MAG: prephenate dehydrogenase [Oscillospiraceae bacterium]|jgi:prephenate dehydrogenase|nr:prephenate dehydrogenase [Oscillospiraceae bacterium]